MTEDEARGWIRDHFGIEAVQALARFATLVIDETNRQNLIAPSTMDQLWNRHLLDSAQLEPLAESDGLWLDIGTGAGFPGMVVALLRPGATIMVEPRRRRAEFLERCVGEFGLAARARVIAAKVELITERAAVISARAVAPVEKLLQSAASCATMATRWLLPRGQLSPHQVSLLRQRWTGVFHVEQSLTDSGSSILVAEGVSRR